MAEDKENNENKDKQSPAEVKARKEGWVPEEDFKGNAENWVDYREFNLRGELMSRISEQSSIINHLTTDRNEAKETIKDLTKLQSQISERAYKEALKDLQEKKKVALKDEDFDGVVNLDEEISELKSQKPAPEEDEDTNTQQNTGGTPQEIVDWLAKPEQAWYHTDITLRGITEGIAGTILLENPDIAPADLIKKVEAGLKKELPHRFNTNNSNQDVDTGGEFNSNNRQKNKTLTFDSLSQEQKDVARRFEKLGVMTKKEYVKSLEDLGEL